MAAFTWMADRLAAASWSWFAFELASGLATSGAFFFGNLRHRHPFWAALFGLLLAIFIFLLVFGLVVKIRRRGESFTVP
ncbi:MAG: hypothetical protein QOE83_1960 [Actinomycetota bacterium]|jgi:hypothetical protein|nr:hypothetical protein [Actinomycetota bacterium]